MAEGIEKLNLRFRVFLFFAFLAFGALASLIGGLWVGYSRMEEGDLSSAFILAGVIGGFGILGMTAWVWFLFDENVARAIQRLATGLRARAHADVEDQLESEVARYLGDLAPAAQAVAGSLSETKNALAEAVERETTRLAVENARLQTVLADVPAGVLLCSPDHQIVFYNGPARDLLSGEHAPGLDRSILDYLRPGPVQDAYERLMRVGSDDKASDLLCATTQTGEVLAGTMRLVHLPHRQGEAPGYVLTLRNVTRDLALHAGREALLAEVFDRVRRPAANLQTVLAAGAARDAEGRGTLLSEVEGLAGAITELGARYDAARGGWWPMSDIRASDLVDGVVAQCARTDVTVTAEAEKVFLRCDAFQVVALLAHLVNRLVSDHGAHLLSLRIEGEGESGAMLSLGWAGDVLPVRVLDGWMDQALEVGLVNVTGTTVLSAHSSEIWPESGKAGRNVLRLPLQRAQPANANRVPAHESLRTAVYDFDLLDREPLGALAETPLSVLTCVVFDTETTGLLPSSGDEIVQIAALRMLGGRPIEGERFETLVDPQRPIPAASTEVHHITEEMVQGAPVPEVAVRRFHAFADGAVLVAHNAPFDLEFLRRQEGPIGARFDHPVLDTVLLSAVIFGQTEVHTLDALTERLGIVIPPEDRHTAMGDTIATAKALEKMIPMLEAQGLRTFGDVLGAVRKHGRLLKDANKAEPVPA